MVARDYKTYARYSDLSYRGQELEDLQKSGYVDGNTLPCLTQDILLHNVDAMVKNDHPVGSKIKDDKSAIELLAATGIPEMLTSYWAEREVQPELTLQQSRAMTSYLADIDRNRFIQGRFDGSTLRRSLPTLIQAAYDEAKEMIIIAVQEHAQTKQQARA